MYLFFVVPLYGYQGYEDKFDILKFLVAIIFLFVSISFVKNQRVPSFFFLNLVIALIVTPSMVLYHSSDLPTVFAMLTVLSFLIAAIVATNVKFIKIKAPQIKQKRILFLMCAVSISFVISIFAFGGARFINFDLSLVYDFRKDASNNLPEIYLYISSVVSKVFVPFGMVIALANRNWFLALVLSFSSVLIFALTGNKAPLFYPFVITAIYWFSGRDKLVNLLLLSFIAIVMLSTADFWLAMNENNILFGWIGSILGRRSLIVPSELNWIFFEFFSANEQYFWSQSKISIGLIEQPFDMSPANLIGERYFGSSETSANTGWVGSGFSNAGYVGTFIYSGLIGLFFSFLDSQSLRLGRRLIVCLFVLPVITMVASADLLTTLLTHGLLLAIFLVMLIKPDSRLN